MNSRNVSLHPGFPAKFWIVIEQPRHEPYRLSYDPISAMFTKTTDKSLIYERGFSGVYGWIGGLGTPPEAHYDVLLFTYQNAQPGDILLGYLIGMFFREDGDHKFVATDGQRLNTMARADLACLDQADYEELLRLYPQISETEGWRGNEAALAYLKANKPTHN